MRAIARRAATIFQPAMLPERSSTNARSRGREESSALGCTRHRRHDRQRKGSFAAIARAGIGMERECGPHGRAPQPEAQDEVAVQPLRRA